MFSLRPLFSFFFFNDTATTEIYTLSLHDALPIWVLPVVLDEADVVLLQVEPQGFERAQVQLQDVVGRGLEHHLELVVVLQAVGGFAQAAGLWAAGGVDVGRPSRPRGPRAPGGGGVRGGRAPLPVIKSGEHTAEH